MHDITTLSTADLLELLRSRRLRACDLVAATVRRLADRGDPSSALRPAAVTTVRAAAERADARLDAGTGRTLEGLPVIHTDLVEIGGVSVGALLPDAARPAPVRGNGAELVALGLVGLAVVEQPPGVGFPGLIVVGTGARFVIGRGPDENGLLDVAARALEDRAAESAP